MFENTVITIYIYMILFDLGYGGENMLYKQGSRFRTVYEIHIYSTAVTSCFLKSYSFLSN